MAAPFPIDDEAYRGCEYVRQTVLLGGYTGADFSSLAFVVRQQIPPSWSSSDADALAKVTLAGGGIEIAGDVVTVTVPHSVTRSWPLGVVYAELTGILQASGHREPLAAGTIHVRGDLGRA